jgi:thimet oligopeptidase
MFGVRYEQVFGLDLWDDSVTAWNLYDGDELIGRFYLDLHPRPDKYGHAACFGYREGVEGERVPQAVLVCNFPDPADDPEGAALMEHGEVTTFFHEFGHLLHALFGGHQQWVGISGINTEWDFVEAPSQMLEEWCFDPEALQMFARHYQTGEPIPAEMVQKLRASEEFGKGVNTAHQMFYAALSLNYYNQSPDDIELDPVMIALRETYSPFPHVPGTHFNASFGHLYGYSAIYYTYMWSQVIAKDMFSRFEREGLLNPETARAYRTEILEAGGSQKAANLVQGFLGRPFSFDAFERYMNAPIVTEEPVSSTN